MDTSHTQVRYIYIYISTCFFEKHMQTESAYILESLHQAVGKHSMLGWCKAYIKLVKSLHLTETLCNIDWQQLIIYARILIMHNTKYFSYACCIHPLLSLLSKFKILERMIFHKLYESISCNLLCV